MTQTEFTTTEPDELRSTLQDQQSVAVTIYNTNLALVKDKRKIQIKGGVGTLAFRDVSAQMRPETALLRSLSHPGMLSVIEQNLDYDLLSPAKLLEKYVGKSVVVIRTNPFTGVETSEQARVLSANTGVVLKIGDRIETGMPGRIVYPDVPANLRDRPTLTMLLKNEGDEQQEMELSYLTAGMSWKADYVAELNATDDMLDLSGWVTLTNNSGATYRNAKLQLMAGNVNQVPQFRQSMPAFAMDDMLCALSTPRITQESLFEYHLYTLEHPTTLVENQTKQVSLLSASSVPVRKEFILHGAANYYQMSMGDLGQKIRVSVFVEFENKETAHLGLPLPKGIVRFYKNDSSGNAQFIGENTIEHTPKNEIVRLKLGDAFDVTASKNQTDFKKLPPPSKVNPFANKEIDLFESEYEIVLKNAKKEAVIVTVLEPIPADWKMLTESHKHEKAASNLAEWKIKVPAEGMATLIYSVQVRC